MFLCPGAVAGLIEYQFSYSPSAGVIEPFAFTITSTGFIEQGPLSFMPFSITDGVSTWIMTQGVAGDMLTQIQPGVFAPGGWCFGFATAEGASVSLSPPCSASSFGSDDGGMVMGFGAPGPLILPDATGTYIDPFASINTINGVLITESVGTITLTVSDAPEPRTVFTVGFALVAIAVVRRKTLRFASLTRGR
jgi:hypothetical protein